MIGRRKGFTLIELLVVIAIILVLAAILFPIFASAQKAAQRSACASNMKQLFIGIQNYAADNNDKTPMVMPKTALDNDPSRPTNTDVCWPGLVLRYIKSNKLFLCPAVTEGLQKNTDMFPATATPDGKSIQTDYAMNLRFSCTNTNPTTGALITDLGDLLGYAGSPQSLSSPAQPSKTVLLIESQNMLQWTGDAKLIPNWQGKTGVLVKEQGGNYAIYQDWYTSDTGGLLGINGIRWNDFPAAPFGHTEGCHVVCADGHVKFLKKPANLGNTVQADGQIAKNGLTWWLKVN